MDFLAVGDRVSRGGRADDYIVVRVDYAACVGDICLLADAGNVILATLQAIRTSQALIGASDRLIARARTLDCD